jgi:hypothetical protein
VYRREDLRASSAVVPYGVLEDLTPYYWRVLAIDAFGTIQASSETYGFSTNNKNGIEGILKGIVYSDSDYSRLAGATLTLALSGGGELNYLTEADGSYEVAAPSGTYTLMVSGEGLEQTRVEQLQISSGEAQTVNVPMALRQGSLDVDGDGSYDALTDGLLLLRWQFGFRDAALVSGALGAGATRADGAAVDAFLSGMGAALDVDGDGSGDALTDGLLGLRWLFGFRDAPLVDGALGAGATRDTAQVHAHLQGLAR